MEILEMLEANKKLLLGPVVKYFRKKCCGEEGHCTNLLEGGYRKNMLMDIGNVVEEMKALCIEQRVKNYRVVNPNDMIGLSSQMEEEEVERLVGSFPIHWQRQSSLWWRARGRSLRAGRERGRRRRLMGRPTRCSTAGTWSVCTTPWRGLASGGSPGPSTTKLATGVV
jgi:hypothetical protein